MKSLGIVALALLCVALFAFAIRNVLTTSREWSEWSADTTRLFTAIEVERMIQDSTAPLKASLDSAVRVGHLAASRHRQRGDSLSGVAESLSTVLRGSQNGSDSLDVALRLTETLRGSLGEAQAESSVLRQMVRSQEQSIAILKHENTRAWALVDSASSVIRRVPKSCRIPVIGVRCPVPVVGVGFTPQPRAFVGIGIPLR